MARLLAGALAVLAFVLLAVPTAQAGHRFLPVGAQSAKLQRPTPAAAFAARALRAPALATPGLSVGVPAGAPTGPCTQTAEDGMPNHVGHDHRDPAQHEFACGLREVAYLPLIEELGERNTVVFGEMDIKADIAAVSVTYPEAGAVFFDVSDPAKPKFLDFYRGRECEQSVLAVNCGAFIDLSADGKLAFIAVQTLAFEAVPDPTSPPLRATPGVDVVDISQIREGGDAELASVFPGEPFATEVNVGGSHTARSHVVPEGPEDAQSPRAPGEYLFAVKNFDGVRITRVDRSGVAKLVPVAELPLDDIHDLFIEDDPIDGRTYLYVAAGFDSGFYVFDVTDPSSPEFKAEWDPTPQCTDDWYAHTIDVEHRDGRRYVTLPAELFNFGDQPEDDAAEGCGTQIGNGDQVGPLWFVDATDFAALGPDQAAADPEDGDKDGEALAKMRAASEQALVTTWTNPAERAGGDFTFSPHNQQIVGDTVFLSDYHGGVLALDASRAFSGTVRGPAARPSEIGFHTPNGTPARPIKGIEEGAPPNEQGGDSYTAGLTRGEIWDAYAYKGHVFAADMVGGFYSLKLAEAAAGGGGGGGGSGGGGTPATATGGATTTPEVATCSGSVSALRSVSAAPQGRGALLRFDRANDRPVTLEVFQQSVGRRISDRLVARFAGRESAVDWNGRANRRGRRVRDGYLLVRATMRFPGGDRVVRRSVLRRRDGRLRVAPPSELQGPCDGVTAFKLERPVFGGRGSVGLGISYRLESTKDVTVTVRRGSRVLRRFATTTRRGGQTHRLRLPAEGIRRGRVQIQITAGDAVATLTARRL